MADWRETLKNQIAAAREAAQGIPHQDVHDILHNDAGGTHFWGHDNTPLVEVAHVVPVPKGLSGSESPGQPKVTVR